MTDLQDSEARLSVRSKLHRNLFVEAGAGTGKTTEFVGRVVELVTSGACDLRSIAAITFTEAAAAELRERIRMSFERKIADPEISSVVLQRCSLAVEQLDEAAISTIHAFAQRLLRAHSIEAGLPPVFEVVDQVQSSVAFTRRWHQVLNDTLASTDPLDPKLDEVLRTAVSLGAKTSHLRSLLRELEYQWHDLPAFLQTKPVPRPTVDDEELVAAFRAIEDAVECCADEKDALFKLINEKVFPFIASFEDESNDSYRRVALISEGARIGVRANAGAKGAWPGDTKAEMHEAWQNARRLLADKRSAQQKWVIDSLVRLLGTRAVRDAEARRSAGALEFHDLLVFARNLLRDNPTLRRFARSNYRYVMVDEFQDTDSLQSEIVALLTAGDGDDDPSGRFTVGDPKQSIYRFRRADPRLFAAVREQSDVRDVVQLSTNFRTLPAVLDWINQTFSTLLSGSLEADQIVLATGRKSLTNNGSVTMLGQEYEKGSILTPAMRSIEAQDIAQQIARIKSDGWAVHDEQGHEHAARLADITILIPTRTSLSSLERALSREAIPYRIESRALIWATQEIRDVISIARAIENPYDSISLVAALRSVAYGCSDVELLKWVESSGLWSYLDDVPDALVGSTVCNAMASLRVLHEERFWLSVPEMLQRIIEERGLFALAFVKERQRETWARLRFLVDRAQAWTQDGGTGMRSFLEWVGVQTDENADALETVVPESDDDAVRIMTIHASKGLEFPIVIVSGLNSSRDTTASTRVIWDEVGNPLVRFGNQDLGFESAGFKELSESEKQDDESEQLRLAYVAVTRARDHLLVSLHRIAKVKCLAAKIAEASPELAISSPVLIADRSVDIQKSDPVDVDDLVARAAGARVKGSRSSWLSGTRVVERLVGEYVPVAVDEAAIDRDEARRLGSAVHHLLENQAFDKPVDDDNCAAAAAEWDVTRRLHDVKRSIELALASPPLREARATNYWKEVDLAAGVSDDSELVIGGQADLVFERGDDLVVVDYKTDPVLDDAGAQALLGRYRWQLLTYANALQRATGRRVVEASILLISPYLEQARVVSIPDLETALEEFGPAVQRAAHPPVASL